MSDLKQRLLNYSKEALVDYLLNQPMPVDLEILSMKELQLKRKALRVKATKMEQECIEALAEGDRQGYFKLSDRLDKTYAQEELIHVQITQIWSDRQLKRELLNRKEAR